MQERTDLVTMKGDALTVLGEEVKVGEPAPGFDVIGNDLSTVSLSEFAGKVCVILSVPSLDTSVCDTMVRRFNDQAAELGDVVVLTVSMDLPFAQSRWCGSAGIENIQTLSDHRDASFGLAYGVLIKELRLLARAAFVVDKDGDLAYLQIVGELTDEPDYEEILGAIKQLI